MTEIPKEQLENLVSVLSHIRLRPGMYFSNFAPAIHNYLHGFQAACTLLGFDIWNGQQEIWAERGWKISALHPISQMQEKGMTDDEIAAEVFGMMLLHLRSKYNISDEAVLKIHRDIREKTEKSRLDLDNPKKDDYYEKHPRSAEQIRKQLEHTLAALDSLEHDMGISSKK